MTLKLIHLERFWVGSMRLPEFWPWSRMTCERWAWFHPFDLSGSLLSLFHLDIDNQRWYCSHRGLTRGPYLESNLIISTISTNSHKSIISYSTELNQDLVGHRALLSVARLVCALLSYPKPLVRLICNHELTLGLRLIQSAPCTLLLASSPRPSNGPQIGIRPYT